MPRPFSWVRALKTNEEDLIQSNITSARKGTPEFKKVHPSEVQEANTTKLYTALKKRVRDEVKAHYDLAMARRNKRV